jgi:hypothetical protein
VGEHLAKCFRSLDSRRGIAANVFRRRFGPSDELGSVVNQPAWKRRSGASVTCMCDNLEATLQTPEQCPPAARTRTRPSCTPASAHELRPRVRAAVVFDALVARLHPNSQRLDVELRQRRAPRCPF